MSRRDPILVFVLAFVAPAIAHAQGTNQAAAEALFDEGKKLMGAGKYAEACPKLAESQKLDPGAGTLLNLAACYEKGGKTASAWVTYKETITAAEQSRRKEWAAQAQKRARALEPTLSKVTIVVADAAKSSGLVVKRDGAVVGSAELGVAIPLDPGRHTIEASAPDKKTFSATIDVGAKADAQTVTIPALEDQKSGAAADTAATKTEPTKPADNNGSSATLGSPPDVDSGGGGGMKIVGLAVAGVGVVGIAAGAFFGLKAGSSNDDAKKNCNADQTKCNSEGLKQVDDAKSAATISTIGFIAGGALLVGGAVLFFTAKSGSEKKAHVTPMVGRDGAGMWLTTSF